MHHPSQSPFPLRPLWQVYVWTGRNLLHASVLKRPNKVFYFYVSLDRNTYSIAPNRIQIFVVKSLRE